MDIYTAIEAVAVRGDMKPVYQFLAEHDAAIAAREALKTKVVAWTTASGKAALSQPKTPTDAEEFAATLVASGKADVTVLDK